MARHVTHKHLTSEQAARYHDDRVVFPIDILSPDEAADYRARLAVVEAWHDAREIAEKPYLTLTMADELTHHPRLLDAVEDVIGPDLLLWNGGFIIKEPHDGVFVHWHQDLTYWGIGPADHIVAAWLALSPVTPENGCVRAIPGSHRDGILPHVDTFDKRSLARRGQHVASEIDKDRAVDIVLRPGQMSLHHGHLIHASSPNRSDERRIGFNLQFITPSVRQTAIDDDSAMLVRGHDRFGHFAPETRPRTDFSPEAIAFVAMVAERRERLLLRGVDVEKMKRLAATG